MAIWRFFEQPDQRATGRDEIVTDDATVIACSKRAPQHAKRDVRARLLQGAPRTFDVAGMYLIVDDEDTGKRTDLKHNLMEQALEHMYL